MSRTRTALPALLMALLFTLAMASTSSAAAFELLPNGFVADTLQAGGSPVVQAGSTPDTSSTSFFIKINDEGTGPTGNVRMTSVDLPPGLVGNPRTTPVCLKADLLGTPGGTNACPIGTQVGTYSLFFRLSFNAENNSGSGVLASVVPPKGVAASFGFTFLGVPTYIDLRVRKGGDYGLTATVRDIPMTVPIAGVKITLWGAPADPSHDAERGRDFACTGDAVNPKIDCGGGGASLGVTPKALLRASTACVGAQTAQLAANSWQTPTDWVHQSSETPGLTGCDQVPFAPTVDAQPTTSAADAPTGLSVDVQVPQDDTPDDIASSDVKTVAMTLPEGVSISPSSADGLGACTDEQAAIGSEAEPACPESSKIGDVSIDAPAFEDPLEGSVYVGTQQSDDPASGQMFRLFLVAQDPRHGVTIKLPGAIKVDPATGRLVATFDNAPQLPFSSLRVKLKGGARAPLATPAACGEYPITTKLTGWNGSVVERTNRFRVDSCPESGRFAPAFAAGAVNPVGGAFSPFSLAIDKADGQSPLAGLSMSLPRGLLAQLTGNVGAQVGSVRAFAGPGASPFVLPGKVFLEGPYGDAPFSLRVVVPAKAGPFDLGEVVVRQKIYVDPIDAHVTVVSDPIPTIVKGVPVRLQRLEVAVDKAGFMVNPTSCAASSIVGTLAASDGQSVAVSTRFQVSGCSALKLKPSLGLTLSGKGETSDGKHPAISAVLTQPGGQANLKKVRVALPLSLALDVENANGLCEFADGSKAEPTCPKASIVGSATAVTPILDEPLSGPVYFVKNVRKDPKSGRDIRTLPKLVIPLVGQNGVKLTLTGTSDAVDDQLVTTFDNIPDAPVSSFKLNINGGKGGILAVSGTDICKATQAADQEIDGQNTKAADADVVIQTPSCPLKVLSKKVTAKAVTLKVGGLGAGKVTVTGKGIRKTTKTISKSTVATITAKRSNGTPGKVMVSFDPTGPANARKTTK
jgi:hypothetical protein